MCIRDRILLSVFWLALGVCNGYMLLKRVTPFNAQDLKAWSEGLAVSKNYFSAMEFVLLGVGIVAVILWVISMWRRGGQYTGKMHRVAALFGVVISIGAYIGLTNIAIDKRVVSNYFGNIAFAYEDYGFPYCFAASVFNTGISEPAGYSKETMDEITDGGELSKSSTGLEEGEMPNIMFVQLESFFDPTEVELSLIHISLNIRSRAFLHIFIPVIHTFLCQRICCRIGLQTVSYTHLDVYKRQTPITICPSLIGEPYLS